MSARKEADNNRSGIAEKVELLLSQREEAREGREWNRADQIRDELSSMGVIVEDGPDGPTWRLE
jgi:cysteinyl-tRNA synthetase